MRGIYFILILLVVIPFASSQIQITGSHSNDSVIELGPTTTTSSGGGGSGSNVTSVTGDSCILADPTTGDVVLTFNTSCANVAGSPWTNDSSKTFVKPDYPQTVRINSTAGNLTFTSYNNGSTEFDGGISGRIAVFDSEGNLVPSYLATDESLNLNNVFDINFVQGSGYFIGQLSTSSFLFNKFIDFTFGDNNLTGVVPVIFRAVSADGNGFYYYQGSEDVWYSNERWIFPDINVTSLIRTVRLWATERIDSPIGNFTNISATRINASIGNFSNIQVGSGNVCLSNGTGCMSTGGAGKAGVSPWLFNNSQNMTFNQSYLLNTTHTWNVSQNYQGGGGTAIHILGNSSLKLGNFDNTIYENPSQRTINFQSDFGTRYQTLLGVTYALIGPSRIQFISPVTKADQYLFAYSNVSQNISGTNWRTINWTVVQRNDSQYGVNPSNRTYFNLSLTGDYRIDVEVSTDVISGNARSGTEIRALLWNCTAYNEIEGTSGYGYNRLASVGKDTASATFFARMTFPPICAHPLVIQARTYAGGDEVWTIGKGTRINIERL